MKRVLSITLALYACALTGCATKFSELPAVDVSKMSDKVLTATEVDSVVRGRQMIGDNIRSSGSHTYDVLRAYGADGTLSGMVSSTDYDKGKWHIDSSGNLCLTWQVWVSACYSVSAQGGKLRLFSIPGGRTVYLQK